MTKSYLHFKYCISILLVILICQYGSAYNIQDTSQQLSEQQLEKVNKEVVFDTVKNQLTVRPWVKNLFEKKIKEAEKGPQINPPSFDGFGKFIKSLAYILFGILIIAIVYFVMKDFKMSSLTKRKNKLNIDLDNIEDIAVVDFNSMLRDALQANDYRMAIRIRYLLILQAMAQKNIIRWAPEKTNRTYVNEAQFSSLNNEFRNITRVFEHVWYGNEMLGESRFQSIEPLFVDLNSKVNTHG